MQRINAAMVQMCLRWIIDSTDYKMTHLTQRFRSEDLAILSTLSESQLEALDLLPVSLFRVCHKTTSVGRVRLENEAFRQAVYRIAMLTELVNFSLKNNLNPLVALGMDEESYHQVILADFFTRQMYVTEGGFSVELRTPLKKLTLDSWDNTALLRDVCVILLADLEYFQKHDPSKIGAMANFDRRTVSIERIAEEMLESGIQSKLVCAYTGIDINEVGYLRRAQQRRGCGADAYQKGRMKNLERVARHEPFHALLFYICYKMLAENIEGSLNARGLIAAYKTYRVICSSLKFKEADILTISTLYQFANAVKTAEILVVPCPHCGQPRIFKKDLKGKLRCLWCKGK